MIREDVIKYKNKKEVMLRELDNIIVGKCISIFNFGDEIQIDHKVVEKYMLATDGMLYGFMNLYIKFAGIDEPIEYRLAKYDNVGLFEVGENTYYIGTYTIKVHE